MTEKESKKISDVAKREEDMLALWQEKNIFEKTLEKTKGGESLDDARDREFVFYDGPPFANGLPHYGHLLAGTMKDVIPRYQTMRGKHVSRKWGWDCHGLPLENMVEKELGLKSKKDIEEYGVEKFNAKASEFVLQYADEWKKIVPRMGRFVDMENDYRTMDSDYTESIWWSFAELFKKDLVYQGFKSMHLCPRCETTLSNFEVNQGYKDITDISVYVKFEILNTKSEIISKLQAQNDKPIYFLAWTTTPWTLPGNVALAVNPEIKYVFLKKKDEGDGEEVVFIIAKEKVEEIFGGQDYEIEKEFTGEDLIGKSYKPVFDYYSKDEDLEKRENAWKIYGADFVNTEEGTGIVHVAPAFGDDDYQLALREDLPFIQHVTSQGVFSPEVTDFAGQAVKPKDNPQQADIEIIKYLANEKNALFAKQKITHSYPHCWRCGTPLLNYATSSWFVKVTDLKDKLVEENKKITWVPADIKEGRFGKWLEGARDWAISRSRYWGAPLPVWMSEDGDIEVLSSRDELLEKFTGEISKVYLIRHGESEKNQKNILDDTTDMYGLTEEGKKQAKECAQKISDAEVVITSPVRRAKETAEIIAKELNIELVIDEGIVEVDSGTWDGKTQNELRELEDNKKYRKLSAQEHFEAKRGGAESWSEVEKRMVSSFENNLKKYSGKKIAFVGHAGPFAYLLRFLTETPLSNIDNIFAKSGIVSFASPKTVYVDLKRSREFDFHRPYIDEFVWKNKEGKEMRRVPEVFDCWYESGSMPYAKAHYPYEKNEFNPEKGIGFPADFIAEGVDQTRGWFYSTLVLGTALFGQSPYKNVIVNGTILAEDGQKMSKSLQNYPDPMDVVYRYGADSLRLYLLSSPVVKAEDFNFEEKAVDEVMKKNILRLQNVLSLFEMYRGDTKYKNQVKSKNVLDLWITARLNELILSVSKNLESYELDRATRPLFDFIDDLSTWYIRRSRDRFKGGDSDALRTTAYVLGEFSKVLAPFAPFMAEFVYQRVSGEKESVHLEEWPKQEEIDQSFLEEMQKIREAISGALELRAQAGIKVRQPLSSVGLPFDVTDEYRELIKEEVNVKEVKKTKELSLDTQITPELQKEGDLRDLVREIQSLRKKIKLTPDQKIDLVVKTDDAGKELVKFFEEQIKEVANIKTVSFEESIDENGVLVETKTATFNFIIKV